MPDDDEPLAATPPRRSATVWFVLGAVLLVAATGGGAYWLITRNEVSTDDAFTDGRAITIAPQVAGTVIDLRVTDNQRVRAGEVLLRIDPRDYVAARDQARGRLVSEQAQLDSARAALELARIVFPARLASARAQRLAAEAQVARTRADLRRQQAVPPAATTRAALDEAIAAAAEAEAQVAQTAAAVTQAEPVPPNIAEAEAKVRELEGEVAQARAQLDQAEVNLSYCTLLAPQDGWVTRRNVERGDFVNVGGEVMALVTPQVWVTANFKEGELDRMRPGQRAWLSVDAYPQLKLRGHVDSIQMGTGSRFSAFPAENATGNFVKIVQRVPVKIDIDSGLEPNQPLPLGLSVVATVELK